MKRVLSLLALSCIAVLSLAHAGDFKLILGEQVEVCEACKRNLERMTVHPACERDYSAQLGLEPPAWKPFDVSGHIDTMERVVRFLATGNESAEDGYLLDERQFEDPVKRISAEEPWAYWAQVDINNDGKLEPVLKLHSTLCHSRNDGSFGRAYSSPIVVLTGDLSGVDRALTELVLQNPRRDGRVIGETNYQLYGVFSYKGQTYFDRWNDKGSGEEGERFTLSIYESTGDRTRKLCQLKEMQATRWFPGLPCAYRHCPSARSLPTRFAQ